MSARPDLVECWVFRRPSPGALEFLLIQRGPDRIFPGIWQPVTGRIEPGERAPSAALREVAEETGLTAADLAAFYDLDQVASFYDEATDSVVSSVIFAVEARLGASVRVSREHEALAWLGADEAARRSIWPVYRDSIELIGRLATDEAFARWFRLDPGGRRLARSPR